MREQLRSLSIPKDQRPESQRSSRPQSGRKRGVILFLLIVIVAAVGYTGWNKMGTPGGSRASDKELSFITVSAGPPPSQTPLLTATGKIVSDHEVQVATKVSGQVVALMFEQGDRVQAGQLLARIEDVLYRARRDESRARLQQAKARLDYQKINYQRVAGLIEQKNAPPIELADAERALHEAKALAEAEQARLDFAQKSLNDCEVIAPIAGVILQRNVEVGDFVAAEGGIGANANARFASIADMDTLRVEVDISELDIARITENLPCVVIPDAYKDRRYKGHVLWIDPGANYSKATVQVKVRIENPDEFLRVEGSAQVAFLTEPFDDQELENKPSIWIPRAACLIDPTSRQGRVFVRQDGRLHETAVTLGRTTDTLLEVTAGLEAGQSIAADGADQLTDGQRVPR